VGKGSKAFSDLSGDPNTVVSDHQDAAIIALRDNHVNPSVVFLQRPDQCVSSI
jgi:hypothetical protein